jgi:hypothetical protein
MSLIVAPGNVLMLTFSPIDRLSLGGLIIFIMESPKIVVGPSDVLVLE